MANHVDAPTSRPKLTMHTPPKPSYLDRFPAEVTAMILSHVSAVESPRNLVDSNREVERVYMARKTEIQRRAIELAVDPASIEVAYMTANLFKFPWHGINTAIVRELADPQWTIARLLASMPTYEERAQFLEVARCVNLLVDAFVETETELEAAASTLDDQTPGFVECFQTPACRTPLRQLLHRQFWGYELQCRANVLRCLGVSSGPYVANVGLLSTVNNFLLLQMTDSVTNIAFNQRVDMYAAMDIAGAHKYEVCFSLGVQMAPYWLNPDKEIWTPDLLEELNSHVVQLSEYCMSLALGDTVWRDPWFQRAPVPLTKAIEGATDGYIDPAPEDATVGTLPALF